MSDRDTQIKFEDFVTLTSRERSTETLFNLLVKAVSQHGFDRVIFSISNDCELGPQNNQLGIFHNYPEDWQKYYLENEFNRFDPVLRYAAQKIGAFRWDEIEKNSSLTKKQKLCLQMGEDAGLNNGIGIPLRGKKASLSGIAVATSEKIDACDKNIDLINAYCNQFYIAYKRLLTSEEKVDASVYLSKREEEILSWVAMGKTDEEISIILGISKNTVDTHIRHIFAKLDVNSRIMAVVKALTYGLITY